MYCFLNQLKVRLAPLLHAAQTPPGPGAQVAPRVVSLRPSLPAPGQLRRAGGYACPRLTPARTICSPPQHPIIIAEKCPGPDYGVPDQECVPVLRFINDAGAYYLNDMGVCVHDILNKHWREAWNLYDTKINRPQAQRVDLEARVMKALVQNDFSRKTDEFPYTVPNLTPDGTVYPAGPGRVRFVKMMYFDDTSTPMQMRSRMIAHMTKLNMERISCPFVDSPKGRSYKKPFVPLSVAEMREKIAEVELKCAEAAEPTTLPGESGLSTFVIVHCHDITRTIEEQRRLESEAAKNATQASLAKTRFLANMSHDIRTPLAGIISSARLLADSASTLSDEHQTLVRNICSSGDALMSLCNDILDITRIEQGGMILRERPARVAEIVESCVEMVRQPCNAKGLSIEYSISEDIPSFILSDSNRLKQILYNLVGNAVQYTDEGKVSIHVHAMPCPVKNCYLRERCRSSSENCAEGSQPRDAGDRFHVAFRVSDTGVGIPESHREEIFKPFIQVSDKSRFTDKCLGVGSGAGLGLKIAAELSMLLKGDISLVSEEGMGSQFTFTLCCQGSTGDIALAKSPASEPTCPARDTWLPNMKVLLADDNPVMTHITLRILQTLSVKDITTVDDGEEALKAAERQHFDIMIVDWHMPRMDGLDLVKAIRKLEKETAVPQRSTTQRTHIIVITADALTGTEKPFLQAGANAFLSKPIEVPLLKQALLNAATALASQR